MISKPHYCFSAEQDFNGQLKIHIPAKMKQSQKNVLPQTAIVEVLQLNLRIIIQNLLFVKMKYVPV